MKLLILIGAPAVGKASVGRIIASKTDFKLFHNHMVMDGIMELFGVGTPPENRLSKLVRTEIIKEAAEAGMDLIITYVWDFASEKGRERVTSFKEIYEAHGGEVVFVELTAPLDVRIARAETAERKLMKRHAPDATRVAHLESKFDYTSPRPFYFEKYHHIDTTAKTTEAVADEVMKVVSQ